MHKPIQKMQKCQRKCFILNNEELERLSKSVSGIRLKEDCRLEIHLGYEALPVSSLNFKHHLSEELNKRVLTFDEDLRDIILSFKKVRVITPIEANMSRKLQVPCSVDVFVFKPLIGNTLEGVVNKKSANHLGCVMYNAFNVSIMKPGYLSYNNWAGKDINVNDIIKFRVIEVDISETIPSIFAELLDSPIDENESTADSVHPSNCENSEDFQGLKKMSEIPKKGKNKRKIATRIDSNETTNQEMKASSSFDRTSDFDSTLNLSETSHKSQSKKKSKRKSFPIA